MSNQNINSLQQKAVEFLDPDECGDASEAILFFLIDSCPFSKLALKNKLILLISVYKYLSADDQLSLGSRQFTLRRILDSGDYGIDIDDLVPLGGGWMLRVQADGGSGSICSGEDEDSIVFSLESLLKRLDAECLYLEEFDWEDLAAESCTEDDGVRVTPGEGIEGSGEPSLELISPTGESIDIPASAVSAIRDGQTDSYAVKVEFENQGQLLSLKAAFNLSDLECSCIGYNLTWIIKDPLADPGFESWVDSILEEGIVMLRGTYSQ